MQWKKTWWTDEKHEPNSLNKQTTSPTAVNPAASDSHHSRTFNVNTIIASRPLRFSTAIKFSHEGEPEWHRAHSDLYAWLGSHPSEMIFNESVALHWACSLISPLIAQTSEQTWAAPTFKCSMRSWDISIYCTLQLLSTIWARKLCSGLYVKKIVPSQMRCSVYGDYII